ncbi:MAG: response regulator transcription factor [Actinomycetota bacterium]
MSPHGVLLVDDQPLVRVGLARILGTEPTLSVVAEASDGGEALDALASAEAEIGVVVMDVRMRGMDGIEATRRIRALDGPPVLVLTTFDEDEILWGAIDAGAAGFVLKEASAEDLIRATLTVAEGGAWLDPSVTPRVLAHRRATADVDTGDPRGARRDDRLTDREHEVLVLMASGKTNAEIAETLIVGQATVKSHISAIFTKLGARDRAGAIVHAYRNGLVEY